MWGTELAQLKQLVSAICEGHVGAMVAHWEEMVCWLAPADRCANQLEDPTTYTAASAAAAAACDAPVRGGPRSLPPERERDARRDAHEHFIRICNNRC